ncbi:glycosyltransferase [Kriegella aquimaris]|uniref:Glycosyltransferase involved in cell wall bisynthesis n=1 Tax=Kriegella aquimaris TaxID=192904 RepID=A0A1G9U605_9FLAO|nr:glycosyltransferase [Kriegella aquimaris]SDM55406.1 Glycosyltransferase involved in cell wall bisynthesis [Kriegella aquimaris]
MKITFVLDTFGGGGKERRCLQLIQGLNKQGYNNIQVIIINNDIAYQELYEANIDLNIINRKNKGLNVVQTCLTLYRLLKTFNPDIVQVWGVFSAFFTNPIRCFMRFKYVGSYVANCNKPANYSVERFTILVNSWLANYVVGNSAAGIKAYGIPKRKAKVIYNGFNEERYNSSGPKRHDIKEEMGINANYIVSMVARLDDNKDHKTFIKAAKLIIKKRTDVFFLIVGNGPNLLQLQSLISQNERAFFNFLGFRSDVENILKITDVSVLCTNPNKHKEGVSNAIMESLAFSVPVVATNDGGTPEIIESGINGFLIKSHDSEQLCENILQILDDVVLKNKLSMAAKSTVDSKFNLQRMTAEYIEMYNLLINK